MTAKVVFTIEETAEKLRISVRTLSRLRLEGKITPVLARSRVLYTQAAIDAFLRKGQEQC